MLRIKRLFQEKSGKDLQNYDEAGPHVFVKPKNSSLTLSSGEQPAKLFVAN